jgi:pyruvate/2-oxoglutarate dehydrogenase complex dihydrolipoamide acyltransferase (E2) component
LSESVAEATLLNWHKKVGEAVARDENLIDIETDKVVLELPAPEAGVLTQVIKGDGGTVVSGEVIAVIDTDAKAGASAAPAAVAQAAPAAAVASQAASVAAGGSKAGVAMPAAAKMLASYQSPVALPPQGIANTGLQLERGFIARVERSRTDLQAGGQLSLGLDNLLSQIADNHETWVYQLGQRAK